MEDELTNKTLSGIPSLQTKAGPRDKNLWVQRLKEEYQALITVIISILLSTNESFHMLVILNNIFWNIHNITNTNTLSFFLTVCQEQ